ncbi:AbiEi antitoxin N-terminal domain-containing protein [Corynebacterium incognita]|uniref:AbiEi antitoxin N-terminal domain-containing protein n=1 Tax=Corynebacterium incognita TaxID=2754725 RepID=A0A7G7CNZ5_9CORY|nr:type IV toxin-antitoxin system AbiEi family antitoxin domain-containing protein [Corynebacterium incognita]QNE89311.1 AbiEi antitoxin N-terminal domain-containing protein [Corynebacterium incognita]
MDLQEFINDPHAFIPADFLVPDLRQHDAHLRTTRQLHKEGWSKHRIQRAMREGKLHRIFRGVYSTMAPSTNLVLRALQRKFPRATFTGLTALQMIIGEEPTAPFQVLIPRNTAHITHRDIRARHTTDMPYDSLPTAISAARESFRTAPEETRAILEKHYAGYPGKQRFDEHFRQLRRIPRAFRDFLHQTIIGADSPPERILARALRTRIKGIEQNGLLGPYRFDFLLHKHKIAIEVDGFTYHRGSTENLASFIRDRWKANFAAATGWTVLRFSATCIDHYLDHVVAQVERIVAKQDADPTPVWAWHHVLRGALRPQP